MISDISYNQIKIKRQIQCPFAMGFNKKEKLEDKMSIGVDDLIKEKSKAELLIRGKISPVKKQTTKRNNISIEHLESYENVCKKVRSTTPFMKYLSKSIIYGEDCLIKSSERTKKTALPRLSRKVRGELY